MPVPILGVPKWWSAWKVHILMIPKQLTHQSYSKLLVHLSSSLEMNEWWAAPNTLPNSVNFTTQQWQILHPSAANMPWTVSATSLLFFFFSEIHKNLSLNVYNILLQTISCFDIYMQLTAVTVARLGLKRIPVCINSCLVTQYVSSVPRLLSLSTTRNTGDINNNNNYNNSYQ